MREISENAYLSAGRTSTTITLFSPRPVPQAVYKLHDLFSLTAALWHGFEQINVQINLVGLHRLIRRLSAFRTLPASTSVMGLCHPREPSASLGMQRPHGAGDEKGKRSARSVLPAKASLRSSLVPQRSLAKRIASIRHPSTQLQLPPAPIRDIREIRGSSASTLQCGEAIFCVRDPKILRSTSVNSLK